MKVYVGPDPDYDSDLTEGEIIDFLQGRIAKQAVPTEVEFVEQIPQTDIGKTDKKALRERTGPATETAE